MWSNASLASSDDPALQIVTVYLSKAGHKKSICIKKWILINGLF